MKVVQCMLAEWRRQGIVVLVYLDDFVVMVCSLAELHKISSWPLYCRRSRRVAGR